MILSRLPQGKYLDFIHYISFTAHGELYTQFCKLQQDHHTQQ